MGARTAVRCIVLLVFAAVAAAQTPDTPASQAAALVVNLEDAKATRAGTMKGLTSVFAGPPKEKLVRKGVVSVAGETFDIYLPEAPYALENTGRNETAFENTATRVSIDANRDGKLAEDEHWFVNLPIRIGDAMFEVRSIAEDGRRVELQASTAPLSGAVVGRRVPPFKFETADGKTVTQDDYKGKAFLLDIWSVT